MSLYIDDKTLASGTKRMMIMGARDCYQRLTNLPANWQKVRIGLLISITDLNASNAAPNQESIGINSPVGYRFAVGLTNGSGILGQAGNRFVGVTTKIDGTYGHCLASISSKWRMMARGTGSDYFYADLALGDGVTFVEGAALSSVTPPSATDPTATTAFCAGILFELNVATAATLNGGYYISSDLSAANDAAMSGLFGNGVTAFGATAASGWWSAGGSPNPVDCQYLYIRWPYSNNRLRILNSRVEQLA